MLDSIRSIELINTRTNRNETACFFFFLIFRKIYLCRITKFLYTFAFNVSDENFML